MTQTDQTQFTSCISKMQCSTNKLHSALVLSLKTTSKPTQAHSSSSFEYILANSNHWFLIKNSHALRFLHPDHLLSVKLTRELFTQECKLAWRLAIMRACVTLTSTEAWHLEESWNGWISIGTEWSSGPMGRERERERERERYEDISQFWSPLSASFRKCVNKMLRMWIIRRVRRG